jgi:hypothetical protein
MPEAEVSLRLAIHLLSQRKASGIVSVAIDGAQVRVGETIHFAIQDFMATQGWLCGGSDRWQATYRHNEIQGQIEIHSRSGVGDVFATLAAGTVFVAEAKKGPLTRSKSSAEYALLRAALGQILTIESLPKEVTLAVAVPQSQKFSELADRWRKAPLVKRAGILILTVGQDGTVLGW